MPQYYYLSHHGIKGQKWGIRRYQNPDGTLTELGQKRYNTIKKKYTNASGKFSTGKDTAKTIFETLGISYGGALGLGATGVLSSGVGALALALGIGGLSVANIIRKSVGREKARRFIEVTGTEEEKQSAQTGRIVSATVSYGPIGGALAYFMGESHIKKIMNASADEVMQQSNHKSKNSS